MHMNSKKRLSILKKYEPFSFFLLKDREDFSKILLNEKRKIENHSSVTLNFFLVVSHSKKQNIKTGTIPYFRKGGFSMSIRKAVKNPINPEITAKLNVVSRSNPSSLLQFGQYHL